MENSYIEIKESLIRLLKGCDPEISVFAEEIRQIRDNDYYFIEIIPTGNITVDRYFTDRQVFISIAYHESRERNSAYLEKAGELDNAIRPVFRFGDRAATIQDSSSRIVDHVLQFSFRIRYRTSCKEKEEFEIMGELEAEIKRE